MDRNEMEKNVTRLAEIAGNDDRTGDEQAEGTGLVFGLLGTFIIAVVRIADALEAVTDPALRVRKD